MTLLSVVSDNPRDLQILVNQAVQYSITHRYKLQPQKSVVIEINKCVHIYLHSWKCHSHYQYWLNICFVQRYWSNWVKPIFSIKSSWQKTICCSSSLRYILLYLWRKTIDNLHHDTRTCIKWKQQVSDSFDCQQEVKQGGLLSAELYKLYIEVFHVDGCMSNRCNFLIKMAMSTTSNADLASSNAM
jgi:hypothetical protein